MYHYGYYSGAYFAIVGVVVLAVALTALLVVLVTPQEKDGKLPYFFQLLHDLFNPKKLVIEKILQVIDVFFTCLSVLIGLYYLLAGFFHMDLMTVLAGLFLILIVPALVRLAYELILLLVIQVKTTREINQKLGRLLPPEPEEPQQTPPEPENTPTAPVMVARSDGTPVAMPARYIAWKKDAMVHCPACGTWYRKTQETCPICGKGKPEQDNPEP